jgi:hypothetical protein
MGTTEKRIERDGSRRHGDLEQARWRLEWSILSRGGDIEVEGVGGIVCPASEI